MAFGCLEGRRLEEKIDLGVMVALLLAEETVELTDGAGFRWEEEEEDDCFECRRREPAREGIVANGPVVRRYQSAPRVR